MNISTANFQKRVPATLCTVKSLTIPLCPSWKWAVSLYSLSLYRMPISHWAATLPNPLLVVHSAHVQVTCQFIMVPWREYWYCQFHFIFRFISFEWVESEFLHFSSLPQRVIVAGAQAKPKPGARSSIRVSPGSGSSSAICAIHHCFPRHISTKQDQKWSDGAWYWNSMWNAKS